MSFFDLLTFIGGLSLFLFGMTILGDGLRTISGGRLEQLLRKFCSSKVKGVALGAGVTALIQSSSATTVMVVALVNSGVMLLDQAVTVIMGANIGTTITSWILSLSGISGDHFFVQLLKPSSFTPILAVIGIIMILRAKNDARKTAGTTLLGFAVLMFGMSTMSGAVSGLSESPTFMKLFGVFSHPLLGMLIGLVVTAIVQSSSASVGILQALASTGLINFSAAFPIIMGQNIGTCVTAVLSAIGGNRNAKRAAMIHLSFNTIGTVIFMILFYSVHALRPFSFMGDTVTAFNIAVLHTVFNLVTTFLLLPFAKQLVRLSRILVPDKKEENLVDDPIATTLRLLDPRFISRPGFALEQSHYVLTKMLARSSEAMDKALDLLFDYSDEGYAEIDQLERQVDRFEDVLGEYLVQISATHLNEQDNRLLTTLIQSVNDIERIGDHAINLAGYAKRKFENEDFSEAADRELGLYARAIRDILGRTALALETLNPHDAFRIEPLEDRINEMNKELTVRHVDRLKTGECTILKGLIIADIYNNLERVSDHCSNIGIHIIQYADRRYGFHDYHDTLDKGDPTYVRLYEEAAKAYPLDA